MTDERLGDETDRSDGEVAHSTGGIDRINRLVAAERILERRAGNHLKEDANPGICYVCESKTSDQLHHTLYFPEETIPVCSGCHAKIDKSGEYPELLPDLSHRPDNYEKKRRRGINTPPKERRNQSVDTESDRDD